MEMQHLNIEVSAARRRANAFLLKGIFTVKLHRVLAVPTAFFGLLFVAPFVVGCGGDSAASTTGATRAYTSTVSLSNGQSGALSMSVTSSGAATGTLTVNDSADVRSVTRAVVATVSLSGTVSSAGVVNLTGHYADSEGVTQNVSVTGNVAGIANGASGGSLALGIFNQTFNGAWTFTATANPGGGSGGGGAAITFSNPSSANADTTNLNVTLVGGAATNLPVIGKSLVITATVGNSYARYASFGIIGDYTVGQSYTLDDNNYSVTYGEGGQAGKQWRANGGTIKITAATSSKITFVITNAAMQPSSGGAAGAFTLNFSGETTALVTQ